MIGLGLLLAERSSDAAEYLRGREFAQAARQLLERLPIGRRLIKPRDQQVHGFIRRHLVHSDRLWRFGGYSGITSGDQACAAGSAAQERPQVGLVP